MPDVTREHELEALIVDLCDGNFRSWWDIHGYTGLSEERCMEMEALIDDVFKRYFERNKL